MFHSYLFQDICDGNAQVPPSANQGIIRLLRCKGCETRFGKGGAMNRVIYHRLIQIAIVIAAVVPMVLRHTGGITGGQLSDTSGV